MLPKNKRIPRKLFPPLLRGAKVFKNDLFLLRVASQKNQNSLFSFSVSKKISKSAVARNRIRRSGYRLIEKYIPEITGGRLISFSFRQMPKNDGEITKNLQSLLIESKLIQNNKK